MTRLSTCRGEPHWGWSCKLPISFELFVETPLTTYFSYPVAYSFVVLPLSVARWLQFNHHHVSSAATFFGVSMFNLSGAINVLLFLIVRPKLLLFPHPDDLIEPEIELAHGNGSRIFSEAGKFEQSPQSVGQSMGQTEGGSRTSAAELSRASSRRRLDAV